MKNAMTMMDLPVGTPVHVSGVDDGLSYVIQPHRRKNVVFLTVPDAGQRNLRCGPGRRIKNTGRRGPWARWKIDGDSDNGFRLQNIGHRNRGDKVFLGVRQGALVAVDEPEPIKVEPFRGNIVEGQQEEDIPMQVESSYELSDASKRSFIESGLLHLPGLVDQELVSNALSSINETLGRAWNAEGPFDPMAGKRTPAIRDLLYKSPLFAAVEELLGKGNAKRPEGGQLALRFPNNKRRDPQDEQWHIDGMQKPHMSPFQLLVGVALSSQPTDDCGNLAVFPGFHGVIHDAVVRLRESRPDEDVSAEDPWLRHRPILGPGAAVQLKMEPGDAVLCHQKLPHRVSRNKSPNVRYMVYFRISHVNHKPEAPMGGLWAHFDGLEEFVST